MIRDREFAVIRQSRSALYVYLSMLARAYVILQLQRRRILRKRPRRTCSLPVRARLLVTVFFHGAPRGCAATELAERSGRNHSGHCCRTTGKAGPARSGAEAARKYQQESGLVTHNFCRRDAVIHYFGG